MADGKIIIDTSLDTKGLEKGLASIGGVAKNASKIAIGAIGGVSKIGRAHV